MFSWNDLSSRRHRERRPEVEVSKFYDPSDQGDEILAKVVAHGVSLDTLTEDTSGNSTAIITAEPLLSTS